MKRNALLVAVIAAIMMAFSAFAENGPQPAASKGKQHQPTSRPVTKFKNLNFTDAANAEAKNPPAHETEVDEIPEPQPPPDIRKGLPIPAGLGKLQTHAAPASATGPSPMPFKTFKGEFLTGGSIPPDTMGAVGTTHIVTVSNDRMRIQTRDGVEISRMTLNAFWAGTTIKGNAVTSTFDPKVLFDRFNNRFIMVSSAGVGSVNSGALIAVSATADPTGTWYRWTVASDPTSTAGGGHWIDYPSVAHNKNWIVIDENTFNYGTAGTGYWGQQLFVLDKQAAYANTLGTISLFEANFSAVCLSSATPETELACGFTMAPSLVEDNTTDTVYLVEDWDNIAGQLRLSKITGTPAAPVLTVGTQFPQSANSWVFSAARVSTSAGYMPQRQIAAYLASGTRIAANDSRIQNAVLRNGTLWTAHTVMLAATPTAAGTGFGAANPDTHSGIQWWQIDPTVETGLPQLPLQRARIEDPTADNCHNGSGGTNTVGPRCTATTTQSGEFFAYPNISVNASNDVLLGFTRVSPLTNGSSGYALRRAADPANTFRDPVIYRPGQANYNIGGGTPFTVRWGDYSASQTDPINDSDFWTIQEYAGVQRDTGIGLAGVWETWWSQIRPTGTIPSTAGNLLITEMRLRGSASTRDEYIEVYNPNPTPVVVNVTDNSDGWGIAFSTNGTTVTGLCVIPNGTVIPARSHFLVTSNPNVAGTPTYSLTNYPATAARTADGDTGYVLDLADNGGFAIFRTSNTANFNAGTRMDSVGFAGIAAGLFKEGAGIPNVTAAAPAGQIAFHRVMTGGVPVDTGANENDFNFVDTNLEVLTATPKVGAPGPENLDGPVHSTSAATVDVALFDNGAAATAAPNLYRDATPGPVATSTFGTITFRRKITNNTGGPLPRLRYRIVDITTNPPVGGNADLRVLSQAAVPSIGLVGGGFAPADGTTLETPPAQAVGGGFNTSLSVPGITLAAPLGAGASTNIAFTAGVQVRGAYNLCLVPEGVPEAAGGPLCFSGNTGNVSITGATIARNSGDPASSSTIATVSDVEDAPGSLVVTVATAPAGIIITGITNSGGTVSATVAATCSAAPGANNVVLQVTDSAGSVANAILVVNVTITSPATPAPTNGGPYCSGQTIQLNTAAVPTATYAWTGPNGFLSSLQNPTRANATVLDAGLYSVTVTVNGCSSAAGSTNVVVNQTPATPTATNTGQYCDSGSGVTVQLNTPTVASATYSWTGPNAFTSALQNPTRPGATPADSGVYSVTVTVSGCTSAAGTTQVDIYATPATPTATNGGPYCQGQTIQLNTPTVVGATYAWTGPNSFTSSLQNPTRTNAQPGDAGSYSVTVTVNGCTSAAGSTTVVVNATPATPTATNGGPYCDSGSGVTVQLNTPTVAGATYSWTGPNSFTSALQNPTRPGATSADAGTYSVTVTVSGCTSAAGTTNVVITNTPATPTATNGGPYCEGQTIQLNTPTVAGATYAWTGPAGFTSSLQNPTRSGATVAHAGSYSVTVTVNGCTSAAGSTTVVVNATPATPTATNGGPYCSGNTIQLNTPTVAGATYSWTGPNSFTSSLQNPTRTNAQVADAGVYSVTVTVNGCPSAPGTTNVVVNQTPATPTATNGGPYCVGATIQLNTPTVAGATYAWTGPNGFASALQNPTRTNAQVVDAGTYSVIVTTNSCPSAAGSTNVVVNPIPATPTASNSGPYCSGATIQLNTATVAGATYAWTGPNGFTSALQNPTRTNATTADGGTYSVTVTVNGCPSPAGTTDVVVNATPATPTASNSGPYCSGATIQLNTPTVAGATYAWTGPGGFTSALQNPTRANATPADAGSYSVTVTVNSCTSAAGSTNVVVNATPATPTASNSGPYCSGATIQLNTTTVPGATYAWTGPNGFTSALQNPTRTNAATADGGTYNVTVTVNGCTSPAGSTSVVVNQTPPTPTITPLGPTTFCTGGSVTLSSSSGSGNQWYLNGGSIGGATAQQYVASAAGDYTVVVTTSGCSSQPSAITTVTVNPKPNASITAPGSVTATSTGNAASVANAGVGATYNWSITNGTITAGTNTPNITFTAGAPGTLTLQVTVTTQAGCSDTKSANVTVTASPVVVTVTSVVPPAGKTTGGKDVTINGTNFQSGATVTFGGSAATNVVFVNSTKLTAKTPAHAAGFVNVTVTNPDFSSGTLTNGYKYVSQQFDANGDNTVDPSDIFYLVNYLFLSGPPPAGASGMDSGDANGDGVVDPSDIFYVVSYLFLSGPAPAAEPFRPVGQSVLAPFSGSLTLGEPVARGKRFVIPVLVSAAADSEVPQALSLRAVFKGDAPTSAVIRRAGMARELEPAFEISRNASGALVYLLSFDTRKAGFTFAPGQRSGVIAEIELDTRPGTSLSIEIDPKLTMLVNGGGTRTANVAGGTLLVQGTSVESPSTPMPKKERE